MSSSPARPPRAPARLSPRATLLIVGLLLLYVLLRPWLQTQLGVPLPGLFPEEQAATPVDAPPKPNKAPPRPGETRPDPGNAASAATTMSHRSPRPDAAAAPLGVLREVGEGRLESPAGLIYKPLRSEHRLDHVLKHAVDAPDRPVHGVFEGDREQILATIDEAWRIAESRGPPEVQRTEEQGRTILVVDLGRTIGYMGGQAGARRNFPRCRHLQLVVEGREVVTAYPVIPR